MGGTEPCTLMTVHPPASRSLLTSAKPLRKTTRALNPSPRRYSRLAGTSAPSIMSTPVLWGGGPCSPIAPGCRTTEEVRDNRSARDEHQGSGRSTRSSPPAHAHRALLRPQRPEPARGAVATWAAGRCTPMRTGVSHQWKRCVITGLLGMSTREVAARQGAARPRCTPSPAAAIAARARARRRRHMPTRLRTVAMCVAPTRRAASRETQRGFLARWIVVDCRIWY